MGREPCGEKKNARGRGAPARLNWGGRRFQSDTLLSNFLSLGLKIVVCKMSMKANFGENCFNSHGYM